MINRFDVDRIRANFPALGQRVNDRPLVYFDNAATTQKPQAVIDTLNTYYREYNSNIHRGVHTLSERATAAYENAREKIRAYINAASADEIVFVRGATEAINLVAQSLGCSTFSATDEVLVTELEHHSNLVPWQMACEKTGSQLKCIPINSVGELVLDDIDTLLTEKTAFVAVGHISNALGTINPIQYLIDKAHAVDAITLIDGTQAVPHMAVDVQQLGCDFYAFSGHKLFGPTGIGVLYGKKELLQSMPPLYGGGDMIKSVSLKKSTYNEPPSRFEAGTPHIAGAIGFAAAIDYIRSIGLEDIQLYEAELLDYATEQMQAIDGLRLIGTARDKISIISFVLADIHPHDIGTIADSEGIAIRAGHHCAMPAMEKLGLSATARASLAFYNTKPEIDRLIDAVRRCKAVFK